ncbi:MAG: ADP-ribosylglycohydrolase family protein [Methanocalculaceae archaeon]|nr:ADP-ribosylglycohydrolase family protein [Methanocalculaceae archaeon]
MFVGGLFGAAVDGAVGLTFDSMFPGVRRNVSVAGSGQFGLAAGSVTDDTLMTLALLQTYLSCGRFDRDAFLLRMTDIIRKEPATFAKTLCTLRDQGCEPFCGTGGRSATRQQDTRQCDAEASGGSCVRSSGRDRLGTTDFCIRPF